MKFLFQRLLVPLSLLLAGGGAACAQLPDVKVIAESPDLATLSPDAAARYDVNLVNDWMRARNKALSDPDLRTSLALPPPPVSQMTRIGFANLLALYQAEHPTSHRDFDKGRFVIEPQRERRLVQGVSTLVDTPGNMNLDSLVMDALSLTATASDIPPLLQAAQEDLELIGVIGSHRDWRDNPQVVEFVKEEIQRLEARQVDPQDTSRKAGAERGRREAALLTLNSFVSSDRDGALQDQFLVNIQKATSDPVATGSQSVCGILTKCLLESGETYDPYVPDLFVALDSCLADPDNPRSLGMEPGGVIDRIYEGLAARPKFCGNPKVEASVLHMFSRLKRDSVLGTKATCVLALVGDRDSFEKVMRGYEKVSADANHAQTFKHSPSESGKKAIYDYPVDKTLFDDVIYTGPDDKLQGVVDHLEDATFDENRGQWMVTIPGYQAPPPAVAATNSVAPQRETSGVTTVVATPPPAPLPAAAVPVTAPPAQLEGTVVAGAMFRSTTSNGGSVQMPLPAGEKVLLVSTNKDGTMTIETDRHLIGTIPAEAFRPDAFPPAP